MFLSKLNIIGNVLVETVKDITRLFLNPQIGEVVQFRNGYVLNNVLL